MSEELAAGIVRILRPNGQAAGVGFIVPKDDLVVTCSHVVQDVDAQRRGDPRPEKVTVKLNATNEEREARVQPEWWHGYDAGDIAILHIEGSLPKEVRKLPLGSSAGTSKHIVSTFGSPQIGTIEGIWGKGEVLGHVDKANGQKLLNLSSLQITKGFSGAPVWDESRRRVIGMVFQIAGPDSSGRGKETVFAIPTETLQEMCPILAPSDICPYRHLEAFTEADAEFFFGRQRILCHLLATLKLELRFLAVLGPSGSGKSSLVQAGLLPLLRQGKLPRSDSWEFIIITRPANDPFKQLIEQGLQKVSEGLTSAVQAWLTDHPKHERLVLIIDQFEEILVDCPSSSCQGFVVQLMDLLASDLPITVVLTMRDDFYSRLAAQEPTLMKWVEQSQFNVPATLEPDELKAIIREPAECVGLQFEPGLVEDILRDATEASPILGERGRIRSTVLPLLEFALTELWEDQEEGCLTHKAYTDLGGVTGGLTKWADQTFFSLEKALRPLARRIFTDLVHPGNESQNIPDSRRRRLFDELYRNEGEQEVVWHVVGHFTASKNRLLIAAGGSTQGPSSDKETVELIHDALLRVWGRLQGWLREDHGFLVWHEAIAGRVQEWVQTCQDEITRRDESRLLGDGELAEASRWRAKWKAELNNDEREFIRESVALKERKNAEEKAWQSRKITWAVSLALGSICIAIAMTLLYGRAERQRRLAVASQLVTQSELVRTQQPDRLLPSILLAAEAVRRFLADGGHSLAAEEALRRGLTLLPRPLVRLSRRDGVSTLAFSDPNGRYLAGAGQDRIAGMWQANVWEAQPYYTQERTVIFTPDGEYDATASGSRTWEWEATDDTELSPYIESQDMMHSIVFRSNSQDLVIAKAKDVQLWEVSNGQEKPLLQYGSQMAVVSLSPDGQYAATARDSEVCIWELNSGSKKRCVLHESGSISAVALSSKGQHVAAASGSDIRVWEVNRDEEKQHIRYEGQDVQKLALSPDGQYVATANGSDVRVWEVRSGAARAPIQHGSAGGEVKLHGKIKKVTETEVRALIFSPDGRSLGTAGTDQIARVWEVDSGQERIRVKHEQMIEAIAFSAGSGQYLATGSADGTIWLWETSHGGEVTRVSHQYSVLKVALSPSGKYLATVTGGADPKSLFVHFWKVGRKQKPISFDYQEGGIAAFSFSRDDKYLTISNAEGVSQSWEASSGKKILAEDQRGEAEASAFPTEDKYQVEIKDDVIHIYERERGANQEISRVTHEGGVAEAVLSLDGKYLVTAGTDGTARVWLVRPEDLIADACSRVPYNLTPQEWKQYVGNEDYRKTCPNLHLHPRSIEEGKIAAGKNEIEDAIQIFRTVIEYEGQQTLCTALQNDRLDCDPAKAAQQLANRTEAKKTVREGEKLAKEGKIEEANAKFNEALTLVPAQEIPYTAWNALCRCGGVWQSSKNATYAKDVMQACEYAIEFVPDEEKVFFRDSRGIVHVINGNCSDAIKDFEAFVQWSEENGAYEGYGDVRAGWIAQLKSNTNPFSSPTVLNQLRGECKDL